MTCEVQSGRVEFIAKVRLHYECISTESLMASSSHILNTSNITLSMDMT